MPKGVKSSHFWQSYRRKWPPVHQGRLSSLAGGILCLMALFVMGTTVSASTGIERPRYKTVYACEGATLNMNCDPNHVINLIRANYGRFSITICNEHGNTEWSVNCMSLRSHRVLHDKCSQRQNCSIPASTRGFGDPCPGTLKYLEAHFQCVPVNPPSHASRPRPPWFLETKTTASSITEDHMFPNHESPFRRDPISSGIGSPHEEGSLKTAVSTTSPTLRPPPWLITNATKNVTSTTTTTPSTTLSTTTSTSEATTTTQIAQTKVDHPSYEEVSQSEVSTIPPKTDTHQNKSKRPSTTTVSTTTLWVPQAEVPGRGFSDEVSWCGPSNERGLFWNWTRGGEVAVQACPGGASGWATRPCDPQGWMVPPDLGECRSVWLASLKSRAEAKDAVLSVANDLTIVTESRPLYGGDVTATARLLNGLTERMAGDVSNFPDEAQREAMVTELVIKTLATGSNLLGKQQEAWGDLRAAEHKAAVTELLLGIEETAFLLADNLYHEKIISHAAQKILMRIQVMETRNVVPVTFPTLNDRWPMIDDSSQWGSSNTPSYESLPERDAVHLQDYITLPPEALLENSENGLVKMVFFSYDGLQDLLQPEKSFGYVQGTFQSLNRTRIVNSRVVSASLGAGRHIELSEPVLITFRMIRTVNVTNPACVFWDYTTNSWSEEDCRVLYHNISHTRCQCDHLTNFAVLMDVHATPMSVPHQMALSVITYVGCVISIVCLFLAIIFFQAFKTVKSDRTTIHKNLCICLLIAEVLFLVGIKRTEQVLACSLIAGFLHYFFLAAFAWMLLEGFQLYMMLVEVFETDTTRARWYYGCAYGIPLVIVAISAVIDPYSYGTPDVCWLRADNYFIFAFVGPVLLVLVANCIFLTLSLILMCRHAANSAALKNKEHSRLASMRSWTRGAIITMFLLGLTWTFGLLYLNESSLVMAYIFTVLNSFQGLFIFVFHCIQNEKLVGGLSTSNWRLGNAKPNGESPAIARVRPQYGATLPPGRLLAASQPTTNSGLNRPYHSTLRHQHTYDEDEKYSFKSCGRDSGHGGSEQEDSPRNCATSKLGSLRLNNNLSITQASNQANRMVNPFTAAAALEPPNRLTATLNRFPIRNQSPWNHTYTEIADGVPRAIDISSPDPVYEEIEREVRSEVQISDLSDEERRQNSDISRQSSRSYGDHRPLLPYTLPDQSRIRHLDANHLPTSVRPHVPSTPEYSCSMLNAMRHPIVQPLSEPNLRNWEAVQRHKDLQQLQHLGEMTVAVLNGEQVVCKLKSPLAPIHESSSQTTTVGQIPTTDSEYFVQQTYSHC